MIETLISSKTRVKLLLKFFLNSNSKAYLRSLEEEFNESTNAIRLELNRFEKAGMLQSDVEGNKKIFTANTKHPLFSNLQQIVRKYVGIDTIIENIASQLGKVEEVYVTGTFARGLDSNIIDLEFVGIVQVQNLVQIIDKVEKLISRKIRYVIYTADEAVELKIKNSSQRLLIWSSKK
jgi:predicted nucleotidyltransferase